MLRTVRAARYVMPFREGGSVPALVEGDDLGLYVMKLRGAAQGEKALVAELIAGELARAAGLPVPELVFVVLDAALASAEPDPELAAPLEASSGLNLALDYLPGSITFDPLTRTAIDADAASKLVLFDALVLNVDRTPRNPNLLTWHGRVWLIDHGASLYIHHGWDPTRPLDGSDDVFAEVASHVLLRRATTLDAAANAIATALGADVIERVVALVPDEWLDPHDGFADVATHRRAYVDFLMARVRHLPELVKEAERARAAV